MRCNNHHYITMWMLMFSSEAQLPWKRSDLTRTAQEVSHPAIISAVLQTDSSLLLWLREPDPFTLNLERMLERKNSNGKKGSLWFSHPMPILPEQRLNKITQRECNENNTESETALVLFQVNKNGWRNWISLFSLRVMLALKKIALFRLSSYTVISVLL